MQQRKRKRKIAESLLKFDASQENIFKEATPIVLAPLAELTAMFITWYVLW